MEDIEVKAGKTRSLGDRLILTIDEGSIAFLSGSVFTAQDRSVPNAKVELLRILEDGTRRRSMGASRRKLVRSSFDCRPSGEVSCEC
jgi:hypothetical protein